MNVIPRREDVAESPAMMNESRICEGDPALSAQRGMTGYPAARTRSYVRNENG